jgi:hypothetical protein
VLFGHHSLARLFRDDAADCAQAIRSLRVELEAGDTGLLSSERFSRLDRAQFARLRDHVPELEMRIVAYLRVRSELLVSRWAEAVKHGLVRSFPEFLRDALAAPRQSPIINQCLLLDVLTDVFGKDRLDVMIYRPVTDLYGEFVRTILGADAVIAGSRGSHAVVNPSLPLHVTECLRLLHVTARARGQVDRPLVTERGVRYLEDPAHRPELEQLQRLVDEKAVRIDVASIDRMFGHLDEELMAAYGDRVRNAGVHVFPGSRVASVRCLDVLDGGEATEVAGEAAGFEEREERCRLTVQLALRHPLRLARSPRA